MKPLLGCSVSLPVTSDLLGDTRTELRSSSFLCNGSNRRSTLASPAVGGICHFKSAPLASGSTPTYTPALLRIPGLWDGELQQFKILDTLMLPQYSFLLKCTKIGYGFYILKDVRFLPPMQMILSGPVDTL